MPRSLRLSSPSILCASFDAASTGHPQSPANEDASMNRRASGRVRASTRRKGSLAGAGLLLAAALALSACGKHSGPAPLAFPSEPSGRIEIKYPLDETLFPPEIVA